MKASAHFYSSCLLGGIVYTFSQSLVITVVASLSTILVDIDHALDFLIFSAEKFSIKNLFVWCEQAKWERVTLIFHSYELYFLLGVIAYYFPSDILKGLMLGLGMHFLLDQIWNCHLRKDYHLTPWFYFLTYLIFAGFHKDNLLIVSE